MKQIESLSPSSLNTRSGGASGETMRGGAELGERELSWLSESEREAGRPEAQAARRAVPTPGRAATWRILSSHRTVTMRYNKRGAQ